MLRLEQLMISQYKNSFITLLLILIIALPLSGCSYFSKGRRDVPSARIQHALDGRIIDDSIYSQGGKILILAFKPDVGIEANEEFDKVTLLIIRGIMDAFHDNAAETKLRIIFTEEEDRADFVLDGYVTQMARPSFLSRWLFMSKKNLLAVEGKITRRDSINPSIFFTQKTIAPDMTFSEIALFCGKKIGDFIIQGE